MKKYLLVILILFIGITSVLKAQITNDNSEFATENIYLNLTKQDSKEESSLNKILNFRRWWQTLLVDAAGALGGAASGAQLCAGHPACIVGGALLGGIGASVARPGKINPNSDGSVVINPSNAYDYIGVTHNRIATDYYSKYSTFDRTVFSDFLEQRLEEYGISAPHYNRNILAQEIDLAKELDLENINEEQAVEYIVNLSPRSVNRESFRNALQQIFGTSSLDEFNRIILDLENNILTSDLSGDDLVIMYSFFSIMRHSAALWN